MNTSIGLPGQPDDLKTDLATKQPMGGQDVLDKEMIHILGGMELNGRRFYHTEHSNTQQSNTYELLISRIFHLILLDYS